MCDQQVRMQVRMEARVLVMRVLHDAKTSVIVQVLHSNAVLKCEVMQDSTKNLGEGQTATICVLEYKSGVIRVSIADNTGNTADTLDDAVIKFRTKFHANAGAETLKPLPPRKRMCFT